MSSEHDRSGQVWCSRNVGSTGLVTRSYFKNKLRASLPAAQEKGWTGNDDLLHEVIVTQKNGRIFHSTWKEFSWKRWEKDENIDRLV